MTANAPSQNVIIYHNPACGTSRNALAFLREAGIEPIVIEYLKTPPDRDTLATLVRDSGLTARALLREKSQAYEELQLADSPHTDEQLIELMTQHPILINRPIVVTPWGTRLCRPSESVKELLALKPGRTAT